MKNVAKALFQNDVMVFLALNIDFSMLKAADAAHNLIC